MRKEKDQKDKLNHWKIIERHEGIRKSIFGKTKEVVFVLEEKETGILDFRHFIISYDQDE